MKKIIWIDVGTHFAQEYRSIFNNNFKFFSFILKRFVGGKLLRRGKFVSLNELRKILQNRASIRKRKDDFFSIFIEANPKIAYKENFYPEANMFFNLALTSNNKPDVSITKLFLGDGDELSQGSSIFIEKHNVNKESYLPTLGVSAKYFFSELESYLTEKFNDYDILLRLNCEGMEDDVIYSVHENFGNKLKLVCGSLKDVEGVKGKESFLALEDYMIKNNLPFTKFYSGIYSWLEGHYSVLELINKAK